MKRNPEVGDLVGRSNRKNPYKGPMKPAHHAVEIGDLVYYDSDLFALVTAIEKNYITLFWLNEGVPGTRQTYSFSHPADLDETIEGISLNVLREEP